MVAPSFGRGTQKGLGNGADSSDGHSIGHESKLPGNFRAGGDGESYDHFEDGLRQLNHSSYGLQAGIFNWTPS